MTVRFLLRPAPLALGILAAEMHIQLCAEELVCGNCGKVEVGVQSDVAVVAPSEARRIFNEGRGKRASQTN
tara:strand:+ start:873 stop:1085 length:213 start_codon:yes stop_codon:yes gene_type:complete